MLPLAQLEQYAAQNHPVTEKIIQTLHEKARKLCDELLQNAGPDILLHGDLHHDNILQNGNDWVAIDPKGVIGELGTKT